jgi:hypothetical protein
MPNSSAGEPAMTREGLFSSTHDSRLAAASWDEVVDVATTGVLAEGSRVALTSELPIGVDAQRDLAEDLASLAVDGGVLIVGVARDLGSAWRVTGVPIAGLAERILRVASSLVTPRVEVVLHPPFRNPADPAVGVLVVTVPRSAQAPHQVDGRYWGRNADGRQLLTDAQIRDVILARQFDMERFESRLRSIAGNLDPVPASDRKNGHLYLLAEPAAGPVAAPPLCCLDTETLRRAIGIEPDHDPPLLHRAPTLRAHPDGRLLTAGVRKGTSGSGPRFAEDDLVWLLVTDAGAVQVACGAGTTTQRTRFLFTGPEFEQVVNPPWVLEFVTSFCRLVAHLDEQHLAYTGSWRLGLFVDRLAGIRATDAIEDFEFGLDLEGFPSPEYLQTAACSSAELRHSSAEVAGRLAQRLLRGLGVSASHLPYEPST